MRFDDDRLAREKTIRDYLLKKLDPETTEEFERHYLESDECFEELQTSQVLMSGLGRNKVEARLLEGVTVLHFTGPSSLTRQSEALHELLQGVRQKADGKVLIDLSRVSKVDSTGLGMLMACYSHTVNNRGILKLLKPSAEVRGLLSLTRIDSILESFEDEQAALRSFG